MNNKGGFFLKSRRVGLTRASLETMIWSMRLNDKTELSLGLLIHKETDSYSTLTQYLSILDSLGCTTTYKVHENSLGEIESYTLNIKLNDL